MNRKLLAVVAVVVVLGGAGYFLFLHDPDQRNWDEVRRRDSIPLYEEFVREWPESRFLEQAHTRIEALRWTAATERDEVDGFSDFIEAHPRSARVDGARQRIEALRWGLARELDRVDAYRAFLEQHPESERVAEVNQRIEALRWEAARTSDATEGLRAFLADYPEGPFSNAGREQLETLRWQEAMAADTIADFRAFLAEYPESGRNERAHERVEALRWQAVVEADHLDSYKRFVAEFPESVHAARARERIDDLTWEAARDARNAADVTAYLGRNEPRHAAEAKALLLELRWEQACRKDTPAAYAAFQEQHPRSMYHWQAVQRRALAAWRVKVVRYGAADATGRFADDRLTGFVVDILRVEDAGIVRFDSRETGLFVVDDEGKETLVPADVVVLIDIGPGVGGTVRGMVYRGRVSVDSVAHACPNPGSAPKFVGRINVGLLAGAFGVSDGQSWIEDGGLVHVEYWPGKDQAARIADVPTDRAKALGVLALARPSRTPQPDLALAEFFVKSNHYVRMGFLCRAAPSRVHALRILGRRVPITEEGVSAWEPAAPLPTEAADDASPRVLGGGHKAAYLRIAREAARSPRTQMMSSMRSLSRAYLDDWEALGAPEGEATEFLYLARILAAAERHEDAVRIFMKVLAHADTEAKHRDEAAGAISRRLEQPAVGPGLPRELSDQAMNALTTHLAHGEGSRERSLTRYQLARMLARSGRLEDALAQLEAAAAEDPARAVGAAALAVRLLVPSTVKLEAYEAARRRARELIDGFKRHQQRGLEAAQESGDETRIRVAKRGLEGFETIDRPLRMLGQPHPEIEPLGVLGSFPGLAAIRGKVVVLSCGATWIPQSVQALPALRDLAKAYGDKDVVVLGVLLSGFAVHEHRFDLDEDFADRATGGTPDPVASLALDAERADGETAFEREAYLKREQDVLRRFVANHELPWPVAIVDPRGEDRGFGMLGFHVILDRKGNIRHVAMDPLTRKATERLDAVRAMLDDLLAEQP